MRATAQGSFLLFAMVEQGYRRKRILFIRNAAEAILGKQVVNGFYQE
jgi:hypothetical protein